MDTAPPSHRSEPRNRTKSSSRLSKLRQIDDQEGEIGESSPSKVALESATSVPNQELLLLSPSPNRKSKIQKFEMGDDGAEAVGVRRRCRNRNAAAVCASPRNNRRLRKRLDQDMVREEKDLGAGEEAIKPRKKRQAVRSKKDKLSVVPSVPSPKSTESEGVNLDRIGQLINDLLMWRDPARSTLWFGFGSLCFLSSCFASGVNFSIFSVISHLGLLFLAVSFILNSLRPRENAETKTEIKLKEDDILRVGRFILPAVNLAISKTRDLFSGEPAMTLKVVPFLLVGAEYGHLLTLWRLCALGFFISFTAPKLYSSYSTQICRKGEFIRSWAMDAWGACSHRKMIAGLALSAFWNLTTVRTRVFAAFICLAAIRYYKQHSGGGRVEEVTVEEEQEQQQEQEKEEEEEKQENDHKELIGLGSESHK
ncbi:PREDICTED: reticulon-like protein B17 [Ipomoea nil]|uniref:reticulon-like protein B17 n=1 Tax=Ipomoea nil TaxID=35883 RepID=UPI000901D58B|nr:PREDICTED: reticulon-like protein B17 [Ipomoea nil]